MTIAPNSPPPFSVNEAERLTRWLGYATRDLSKCLMIFSHSESHLAATLSSTAEGTHRTISLFSLHDLSSACQSTYHQGVRAFQLITSHSSLYEKAKEVGELVLELFGLLEAGSRVLISGNNWGLYMINEPVVEVFNAFCDLPGAIKEVGVQSAKMVEARKNPQEGELQIIASWLKIAKNIAILVADLLTLLAIPFAVIGAAPIFLALSSVVWITHVVTAGIDHEVSKSERRRCEVDRWVHLS